ncbi:hypothetical protein TSUD_209540 [Trifolium subterraneum]|uniref:Uncharacterized protein n=1 Tax=Trifolium subterraneum TaxID=3900 RepID=A0A2Z6NR65_TRISU|nr:hypothetical protein TSUD_209540 [Trifolium subterraneum]
MAKSLSDSLFLKESIQRAMLPRGGKPLSRLIRVSISYVYFPASIVTDGLPMMLGFAWALNWTLRWALGIENGKES